MNTNEIRDEFLSEEDLDLRNCSGHEIEQYWDMWILQAQSTNDIDKDEYSHGVFTGYRKQPDLQIMNKP